MTKPKQKKVRPRASKEDLLRIRANKRQAVAFEKGEHPWTATTFNKFRDEKDENADIEEATRQSLVLQEGLADHEKWREFEDTVIPMQARVRNMVHSDEELRAQEDAKRPDSDTDHSDHSDTEDEVIEVAAQIPIAKPGRLIQSTIDSIFRKRPASETFSEHEIPANLRMCDGVSVLHRSIELQLVLL
jgi:hypothetical protein